jgi:hypothetical protein
LRQGDHGSLRLCDQGMAEWSNNGDPDDYPPRWLSRALCKAGRICSASGEGAAAGDHVAIEYRFAGNRNEPLPSPRS